MDNAVEKYRQRRDERIRKRMDEFKENDHPRDESGRFTSGGGGGKAAKKSERLQSAEKIAKILDKNRPYNGYSDTWKENVDKMMDLFEGADKDEKKELDKILTKYGFK